MVMYVNDQILQDRFEVWRRWAEYFQQTLKVKDVREANINAVGDCQMPVFGEFYERAISIEAVRKTVN